jgi:hypothetical protein
MRCFFLWRIPEENIYVSCRVHIEDDIARKNTDVVNVKVFVITAYSARKFNLRFFSSADSTQSTVGSADSHLDRICGLWTTKIFVSFYSDGTYFFHPDYSNHTKHWEEIELILQGTLSDAEKNYNWASQISPIDNIVITNHSPTSAGIFYDRGGSDVIFVTQNTPSSELLK